MIESIITDALSGGGRRQPTWAVEGTNVRGEQFRIARYFTRADARDYAEEINGKGGDAKVVRI